MRFLRLLDRFARTTLQLLFSPGRFFERRSARENAVSGVKLPLLYAVLTHWIAAAASFGWGESLIKAIRQNFAEVFMLMEDAHELGLPDGREQAGQEILEQLANLKQHLLPWLWGASSVLLSPFKTLGVLAWATFFLFIASRLLVPLDPERPVTLRGSLRIACFASATALWKLIPLAGPLIAETMLLLTTWIAVRKTYNISNLRAISIALFPQLLFIGILLVGLGFLGLLVFRVLFTLFGLSG